MDVPVAANVLGTIGAVCWSVQLIPQIVINYRRHNAVGLQPTMMMLWAWAGVPLGVYNVVKNFNIALQVQPQILTFLSLLTWIQCFYYEREWSVLRALVVVVPIALFMGGLEAALIVALRIAHSRDIQWPITLMAILSAVLLAAGVLRHYWDIYVHRTVRGISFIFVGIDAAGDIFSLVSVLFQPRMDVLGLIIYGTEFVLWLGVFACGGYFNLVPWIQAKIDKKTSARSNAVLPLPNGCSPSNTPAPVIAMHDLPSSTSVFRTPSVEISIARARTGASRRTDPDDGGDEASAG
ncbi:PQ loop repeat protein [Lophium mytilinum]|uniref:PQ loop repeat protein n=1 Tax=Lophium mytilinum TaxID=390894 RepID=A0A6A6QSW0_9PEZI|nr:PQ loop repeat protein [Lophium mytilinum]